MTSRGWFLLSTVGLLTAAAALGGEHLRAQRGLGIGPPDREKRSVVGQFDADSNGRLNDAERAEARAWLATQSQRGAGPGRRGFGAPPEFAGRFGGQPTFFPPGGRGGRGFAMATPGPHVFPSDVTSAGSAPLYDPEVRTIFIDFPATDWERELADFYDTDVDVRATVTVDGCAYPDVGVHFRGMSSFIMVPAGSKRSLNLSFDFAKSDQRLLGYRTLNLLNANGNPSFLRPVLYAEIARHYVPTPRTNYVRVVINGEYWGVYINAQQFSSDFTRDFFASTKGARWKVPISPGGRGGLEYLGDSIDAYRPLYQIKTKDSTESWQALIELCRVLDVTPPASLEAALAPMLDVDETLKFLALEVALVNSDGYWTRASDYSLYRDARGRFHVLPHDTDEALAEDRGPGPGRRGFGGGDDAIALDALVGLNDATTPLRSKLLAVPALRARYLAYVRDIAEHWLDWRTLGPLASTYQALIATHVLADTKKLYTFEAFEAASGSGDESVKAFADSGRAFLLGEKQ